MAIQVTCPNGHTLKVSEEMAGKTGLCPVCKAKVTVPKREAEGLTEEAILEILTAGEEKPTAKAADTSDLDPMAQRAAARRAPEGPATPRKTCPRCHAIIPGGMKICPNCKTYVATLEEV
jgi:RNA polymerase subunit RPABC4/transcription elongation factor Spt4